MTIRFTCPKCQKKYALQDHLGGSVVECSCGQRLQLPKPAATSASAATSAASATVQHDDDIALDLSAAQLVSAPATPRKPMLAPEPDSIPLAPPPPRPSAPAPYSGPHSEPAIQSAGVTRKSGLSSGAILGIVAIGAVVLIGGALLLFGLGDGTATDADIAQKGEMPLEDDTESLDNPDPVNEANPTDAAPNDSVANPTSHPATRQEALASVGPKEVLGPFEFQVPDYISIRIPVSDRPAANGESGRGWVGFDPATRQRSFLLALLSNPAQPGSISDAAAAMQERLTRESKLGDIAPRGRSIFRHTDLAVARSSFTATKNTEPVYGVTYHTMSNGQSLTIMAYVSAAPTSQEGRILDLLGSSIALANGGDTDPAIDNPPPVAYQPPVTPPTQQGLTAGASQQAPLSPTSETTSLGPFRFQPPKELNLIGSRSIDGDVSFRLWGKNSSSQGPYWGVFTKRGTYSSDTFPSQVDALAEQAAGLLRARNPKVGTALVSAGQIGGLEFFKQTFRGILDFNGGSAQLHGFVIASFVDDMAVVVVGATIEAAGQSTYNHLYQAALSIEYDDDLPAGPREGGGEPPSPLANVDPRYAALLLTEQDFNPFALRVPQGMQPSDVKLPLGQTWSWQAAGPDGPCYFVVNVSDSLEKVSAREDLTTALLQREFGPGSVRFLQNYSNIAQQGGVAFNRAIYTLTTDGQAKKGAFFHYSGVHQGKRLIVAGLVPGVPANNPFYLLLESAARTAHPLP